MMRTKSETSFRPEIQPVYPSESQSLEQNQEFEQRVQRQSERVGAKQNNSTAPSASAPSTVPVASPALRDPEIIAIEKILERGMENLFLSLNQQQQIEFQRTGEATAVKIKVVLAKKAYRIKEIVNLIVQWLKKLPGINKFYLEQEAKIKADAIVSAIKHDT